MKKSPNVIKVWKKVVLAKKIKVVVNRRCYLFGMFGCFISSLASSHVPDTQTHTF